MAEEPQHTTYAFRTVDSRPMELDIINYPAAVKETKKHKTMVFFHGGGLIGGNRRSRSTGMATDLLLQRGWTIISADYQLMPESSVADMREDVLNLEQWLLNEGTKLGIKFENLAMAGTSAGSFIAILALSSWKLVRPKAFYSLWAMIDLNNEWYSRGRKDTDLIIGVPKSKYPDSTFKPLFDALAKPEQPKVWYDTTQPSDSVFRPAFLPWALGSGRLGPLVTQSLVAATGKSSIYDFITPSFPPTVAVHGLADSATSVNESRKLISVLEKLGIEGHVVEIAGADHGLRPNENFKDDIEKGALLFDSVMDRVSS